MEKQVVFPFLLDDTEYQTPIGVYVINFKRNTLLSTCFAIEPSGADTSVGGFAQFDLLKHNPEAQDLWEFDNKVRFRKFSANENEFDILCEDEIKNLHHSYIAYLEPQDLQEWMDMWVLNYPKEAKPLLAQQRICLEHFKNELSQIDNYDYQTLVRLLHRMAMTKSLSGCMQLTAECGVVSPHSGRIGRNKNLKANIGKLIQMMFNRNDKRFKLI